MRRGLRGSTILLCKLPYRLYRRYVKHDTCYDQLCKWYADRGDETIRIDYPLSEESIVFDVGGYVGDFTAKIVDRYRCTVYLFEPIPKYYQASRNRFSQNRRVICINRGLSSQSGELFITDAGNESTFKRGDQSGGLLAQVDAFQTFVDAYSIDEIALVKLNIEGGEYDVLPHLIDTGLIRKIKYLQVQFHPFIEDAEAMREEIRVKLRSTHVESWNYPFVWESWERKRDEI